MLFCIDIGNTNTVLGVADGRQNRLPLENSHGT